MPYAQVEVHPRMDGFHQAVLNGMARASKPVPPRPPGKLVEYPNRAAHARAHRLHTERQRRDRRRARTGRTPIQLRRRAHARILEITNAFDSAGLAFARAGQAVRQFAEDVGPAIAAMQRRIDEMVYAAAMASVPCRFVASPYITVDDLRRQMAEAEQAEHYRAYVEDRRVFASGGIVHAYRAPDDDRIPVQISPGEAWGDSGNGPPSRAWPASVSQRARTALPAARSRDHPP